MSSEKQGTSYPTPQSYQQYPMVQTTYGQPGSGSAPEVQHNQQQGSFTPLVNEGEQEDEGEGKTAGEREKDELLPGSGPGGVPHKYFRLSFEHFFEEDKDTMTFHALHKVLGLVYKYTKLAYYHFFVILFGIPITIVCAFINSLMAFVLVWLWGPVLRLTIILTYAVTPLATVPIQAILTPLVDVQARFFRQIRVHAVLGGSVGLSRVKLAGQEHLA